jgi:hypothetical protein
LANRTGTYCQLQKSEKTGIAELIEKHKPMNRESVKKAPAKAINPDLPKPAAEQKIEVKFQSGPKLASVDVTAETLQPVDSPTLMSDKSSPPTVSNRQKDVVDLDSAKARAGNLARRWPRL